MPQYRVARDVEDARGTQYFTVFADNEADALRRVDDGEGTFDSEDIEVQDVGKAHSAELVEDE
jgi:hypothetical protein